MIAWHFAPADRRLRYGDGRLIEVGVTHTVTGPPALCRHGLHASERAIDALWRTPGPWAYIVRLGGEIVTDRDEAAATERAYLAGMDASEVLWAWARWCALQVVHLWDAPDVVRRYLETGDPALAADAADAADAAEKRAWDSYEGPSCAAASAAAWTARGRRRVWEGSKAAARALESADGRCAYAAEEAVQNAELERRLREAMGVTDEQWTEWTRGEE